VAECCSAAHNLKIVEERLSRTEDNLRKCLVELEELRSFKRLMMALADKLPVPEIRRG
jgi:hypothetical protein